MSSNGSVFRVILSGALRQDIRLLAKIASAMGVKAAFLSSLVAINQRLRNDPLGFGEQRFRTSNPDFNCRVGAIQPVVVQFAVHEQLRFVWVVKVFLMGA